MVFLSFDVASYPNLADVAANLSLFAGRVRSFREVLEEAVDEVVRPAIGEHFVSQQGLDDEWAELADYTKRERKRQGFGPGPILDRTGKLKRVAQLKRIWTFTQSEAYVSDLSGAEYGVYHQEGTRHMPQRDFLWISEAQMQEIEDRIGEWYTNRMGAELVV